MAMSAAESRQAVREVLEQQRRAARDRGLRCAHFGRPPLAEWQIDAQHLPEAEGGRTLHAADASLQIRAGTSIADAERRLVLATLDQLEGDKKRAAEVLGISLKTLYDRLNVYAASSTAQDGGASSA